MKRTMLLVLTVTLLAGSGRHRRRRRPSRHSDEGNIRQVREGNRDHEAGRGEHASGDCQRRRCRRRAEWRRRAQGMRRDRSARPAGVARG